MTQNCIRVFIARGKCLPPGYNQLGSFFCRERDLERGNCLTIVSLGLTMPNKIHRKKNNRITHAGSPGSIVDLSHNRLTIKYWRIWIGIVRQSVIYSKSWFRACDIIDFYCNLHHLTSCSTSEYWFSIVICSTWRVPFHWICFVLESQLKIITRFYFRLTIDSQSPHNRLTIASQSFQDSQGLQATLFQKPIHNSSSILHPTHNRLTIASQLFGQCSVHMCTDRQCHEKSLFF